jgi:hypothetical protein
MTDEVYFYFRCIALTFGRKIIVFNDTRPWKQAKCGLIFSNLCTKPRGKLTN